MADPFLYEPAARSKRSLAIAALVVLFVLSIVVGAVALLRAGTASSGAPAPSGTATVTPDRSPTTTASSGERRQVPVTDQSSSSSTSERRTQPLTASIGPVSSDPDAVDSCASGVTFNAWTTIRVNRVPATVRYTWIRSDGAVGPVRTAEFLATDPLSQTVYGDWTVAQSGRYGMKLRVIDPTPSVSHSVEFALNCTYGVRATTPALSSSFYDGPCTTRIPFEAESHISALVAADVRYRWVRSDGGVSTTEQVRVTPGRSVAVRYTWSLANSGRHWVALEILSPVNVPTDKAEFVLQCR